MDYELIRSGRRTLAVEVRKDGVIVRAPYRTTAAEIEAFLQQHSDWIEEKRQKAMSERPSPMERDFSAGEEAALRARAASYLPKRVEEYVRATGLMPAGITITGARTRFGSCSVKNRLSFSWRLMCYPDPAIDYVIVHELCHIREKNHGKRFYALVGTFMPDWKRRRDMLRQK